MDMCFSMDLQPSNEVSCCCCCTSGAWFLLMGSGMAAAAEEKSFGTDLVRACRRSGAREWLMGVLRLMNEMNYPMSSGRFLMVEVARNDRLIRCAGSEASVVVVDEERDKAAQSSSCTCHAKDVDR